MTSNNEELIHTPALGGKVPHFGALLRAARERRDMSLEDIAMRTKVSRFSLGLIEQGRLDDLPADVFVRGFIRSYARVVGIPEAEPIAMLEKDLSERRKRQDSAASPVVPAGANAGANYDANDEEGTSPRRRLGLAVFVIIVLAIATITLSLFLRQPPQAGEGLSQMHAVPAEKAPAAFLG